MTDMDFVFPPRKGMKRFVWGFYVSEELFEDDSTTEAVVKIVREDVGAKAEESVREAYRRHA